MSNVPTSLCVEIHLPRIGSADKNTAMPPKGCVTVRVGAEGEEQRRFTVPLVHLNHPLFGALLEEAEEEYGFDQKGAIAIPCRVERFVRVEDVIGREIGGAHHHGHGHHHHHHHHHDGRGHHHLPLFAGCFRA